jgi:hypothetical protein
LKRLKIFDWAQPNEHDPQITHFSDSILYSIRARKWGEEEVVSTIRFITGQILNLGFFIRGGVSQGPLYHSGSLVYGPGIISAYLLESRIANYPRIILEESLSKQWDNGPYVSNFQ